MLVPAMVSAPHPESVTSVTLLSGKKIKSITDILCAAKNIEAKVLAVAAAHDDAVIKAVIEAKKLGIVQPILIGNLPQIAEILLSLGEDPSDFESLSAISDTDCAKQAIELVKTGKADFLMKGILSTADLMRAVIDKKNGLHMERLISHVMLYKTSGYPKLLVNTDAAMNTYPDLAKKADILENAAIVLKALGYDKIYAACVCGAEVVNPKIQATVDAFELTRMMERWEKYNMTVFGPVGFDLAISEEACRRKGYQHEGGGKADIILVPSYEVGNGIGKALTYFAESQSAGIMIGAKVPIVLASRADSAETKLASIALGSIIAGYLTEKPAAVH